MASPSPVLSALIFPRHHKSLVFAAILTFTTLTLYGLILLRQRRVLDWLKSKITYPRTGYVAPPYAEDTTLPVDLTVLSLPGADATPPENANRLDTDRKRRLWLAIALTLAAVLP